MSPDSFPPFVGFETPDIRFLKTPNNVVDSNSSLRQPLGGVGRKFNRNGSSANLHDSRFERVVVSVAIGSQQHGVTNEF